MANKMSSVNDLRYVGEVSLASRQNISDQLVVGFICGAHVSQPLGSRIASIRSSRQQRLR